MALTKATPTQDYRLNAGTAKQRLSSASYFNWRARYHTETPLEDQWKIHYAKHYGMAPATRARTWYERLPEALRPQGAVILKTWAERNGVAL